MPPSSRVEAYLDIETTGLSWGCNYITVVGVHVDAGDDDGVVQLVGEEVTRDNLLRAMEGVDDVFTYNGSRFDLPFIQARLGVDLAQRHSHCDLMLDCWRNNLYGGLKAVEARLGIERRLKGVDGLEAVRLWWRYRKEQDEEALRTLLDYNREDLLNLKALRCVLVARGRCRS